MNHIHYKTIQSTNNQLKRLLSLNNLPHFTVVSACYQTSGRGQRQNVWESQQDKNLLLSILLKPTELFANNAFIISQTVSVAIVKFLQKYTTHLSIKWPNDIYWQDKKICGILIENSIMGEYVDNSIVGIGLNINQKEFSENLPNPISLANITDNEFPLDKMLSELIETIEQEYKLWIKEGDENIKKSYHNQLYRLNTLHTYQSGDEIFEAKIEGVCSDGRLILKDTNNKLRYYAFKEVEFRLS